MADDAPAVAAEVRRLGEWRTTGYLQGRSWLSTMELDTCYMSNNALVLGVR